MENLQNGQLKISDDVIAMIAALAISDQEGIYTPEKNQNKKKRSRGITVTMDDGAAVCNIDLVVCYGTKLTEVGPQIQDKVKDAVENMTGLTVKEVNLNIVGIK